MVRRSALILLAAFSLSVLVRLPHLDRPLSGHHEFCTALVLIVLHNWWTHGFCTLQGGPADSFLAPADRFPPIVDGPSIHEGVHYYFSHPPFAYDLPYALFSITGVPPSAMGLQILNILFHLVCAWCLWRIVRVLAKGPDGERAGTMTAMLYLFMPAPLWFHGNAYMSDMFVQNFWLLHLAVAVPVFMRDDAPRPIQQAGMAGWLFVTVYTSWLGVWAGMVVVAMAVHRYIARRDRRWLLTVVSCSIAVIGALCVMLWRYAQVMPATDVLAYLAGRLEVRDAAALPLGLGATLRQVLVNYRTGFLPVLLLIVVVAGVLRWKGVRPVADRRSIHVLLLLTGVPVLLDHAVLLEYAIHDFTALKAGPFLCALAGIGLAALPSGWRRTAMVLTCAAGVLYFYKTNPAPSWEPERYAWEQRSGLAIKAEARPDEPVFILGPGLEPQVWWYARRTIFRVDDLEQVRAHLRGAGLSEGVVFTRQGDGLGHVRVRSDQP